jgi:hypothetical protein
MYVNGIALELSTKRKVKFGFEEGIRQNLDNQNQSSYKTFLPPCNYYC